MNYTNICIWPIYSEFHHFNLIYFFCLKICLFLLLESNCFLNLLRCKTIAKPNKHLFCISCILISITIQWFQHHLLFSKRRLASWLSYKAGIQFPAPPIGLFCDFANSQSLCTLISPHYKGESSTFLYHNYVLGNIRTARYESRGHVKYFIECNKCIFEGDLA